MKNAVGGGGAVTSTATVFVPVRPPLSVTVSVALYVPAAAYLWCGVEPVPVVPSPKFHAVVRNGAVVGVGRGRRVEPGREVLG